MNISVLLWDGMAFASLVCLKDFLHMRSQGSDHSHGRVDFLQIIPVDFWPFRAIGNL